MKMIIRSLITKFLAFLLCIVTVGISSYLFSNAFVKDEMLYQFEKDYTNSYRLDYFLNRSTHDLKDMIYKSAKKGTVPTPAEINPLVEDYHTEYYAQYGDIIISNTQNDDINYYKNSAVSKVIDETGRIYFNPERRNYSTYDNTEYDDFEGYKIYVKINDSYLAQFQSAWTAEQMIVDTAVNKIFIFMSISVLSFIYLCWVAGKKSEDEEIHMLLIDRMFIEFNLAFAAGILICALALILTAGESFIFSDSISVSIFYKLIVLITVIAVSMILTLLLSLIRNFKNKTFLKRSLIFNIIRFTWKLTKKIAAFALRILIRIKNGIAAVYKSITMLIFGKFSGKKVIGLLLAYTGIIALLSMVCILIGSFFLFLVIASIVVLSVLFVAKHIRGFDKIVEGISQIRYGNLNYKITDCPIGMMSKVADDVNEIADGLRMSLEREIRAERMKSELITNVSHDLKTPLTSIINYTDLLSKEHLTPNEANDYVAVIRQKSERLKNLTSDLFDISKVQSGAEDIVLEKIDICLLLKQSLAELDETIQTSTLDFKISIPEYELYIMADGKKMSRVLENLIVNALKYSMEHTRVYISIKEDTDTVSIEFKNIASYEMNFDNTEILERFVRGDSSRTTEGSGLGLAIAQSYTTACGGILSVKADGDLFKALIVFTQIDRK